MISRTVASGLLAAIAWTLSPGEAVASWGGFAARYRQGLHVTTDIYVTGDAVSLTVSRYCFGRNVLPIQVFRPAYRHSHIAWRRFVSPRRLSCGHAYLAPGFDPITVSFVARYHQSPLYCLSKAIPWPCSWRYRGVSTRRYAVCPPSHRSTKPRPPLHVTNPYVAETAGEPSMVAPGLQATRPRIVNPYVSKSRVVSAAGDASS